MLNRFYFLYLIFFVVPLLLILNSKIMVTFFILYPLILFPYFYPSEKRHPLIDKIFLCVSFLLLGIFIVLRFSFEIIFLGVFQLGLILAMYAYRKHWKLQLADASYQKEIVDRDLETFNKKYDSRMNSLQHLEKQVTGLLDLFEVAKEFSEFLSFDGITEILFKRVRPLFPVKTIHLLLYYEKPESTEKFIRYQIDEKGVTNNADEIRDFEQNALTKFKSSKSIIHHENLWLFPLLFDDVLSSILIVEGGHADDLAKYEVLSAFLTLQVSKIRLYNSVRELAIRDSLTHVFVRRHFLERFEEELKRSIKFSIPLAVLMLDIDHFKRYNDEYGHIAGDATLKQVADLLMESLRKVDIVGRYGGEEFIVVIPEARQEGAMEISERIRSNIARHVFKMYNSETRVTVSIGMALFTPEVSSGDETVDVTKMGFELTQKADKALYQAKEEGRNQVVLYRDK